MIFGHLTVTATVHREVRRFWPRLPIDAGPLLFGAYLPDILDKPIGLATGLSGRGYGHSIVVQAVVLGALLLLLPRHRRTLGAIALGATVHLLEDTVELPVLFAPLLGPIPFQPPRGFFEILLHYYTSGSVSVWLEAIATAYWLVVIGRAGLRGRRSPVTPERPAA